MKRGESLKGENKMTTKYFYNGKLARTSKSERLSYNFAIYNEKLGGFSSCSKDYDRLVNEIMGIVESSRKRLEEYIKEGDKEMIKYFKNRLEWWESASVVKLEKVVIE